MKTLDQFLVFNFNILPPIADPALQRGRVLDRFEKPDRASRVEYLFHSYDLRRYGIVWRYTVWNRCFTTSRGRLGR